MVKLGIFACLLLVVVLESKLSNGQVPPRLNIPGAFPVGQPKQSAIRQRIQQLDSFPAPRPRRPIPHNAIPVPIRESVRPVVEEPQEEEPARPSAYDDEVSKLGLSSLQSAVQQVDEEPVPFKQERPLPILRQDIRESPVSRPVPIQAKPVQNAPRPVIRQELRQENLFQRPAPQRQEYEAPVQHARRPAPQPQQVRQQPQPIRQAPARIAPRPTSQYLEEDESRTRKPNVQILRKYRTDNADGSITWGYDNEDGSFKEETIGVDCITRGKYGYVDPDGVKREYNYETGGVCEDPEEELPLQQQQVPVKAGGAKKPYRLPAAQYVN